MANLQAFGKFADRDRAAGKTLDRKQGLMLLRGEPHGFGGIFTKTRELS
jgi:hypothetical protein